MRWLTTLSAWALSSGNYITVGRLRKNCPDSKDMQRHVFIVLTETHLAAMLLTEALHRWG